MTVFRVQNQDIQQFLRVDVHEAPNYQLREQKELNVFQRVAMIAMSLFHSLKGLFFKVVSGDQGQINQIFLKAEWEKNAAFSGISSIFERHIPNLPPVQPPPLPLQVQAPAQNAAAEVQEPIREQATANDLPRSNSGKIALRLAISHTIFAGALRSSPYYAIRTQGFSDIVRHYQLQDGPSSQQFANGLQVVPNLFVDRETQINADNSWALIESCTKNIPKGYSRIIILENPSFNSNLLVRVAQTGNVTELDFLDTDYIPGNFNLHFVDLNGQKPVNPDVYMEARAFLDPSPYNEFDVGCINRLKNEGGLKIHSYLLKDLNQ